MTRKYAEMLLLITIGARSTSYVFSKIGLAGLPPLELLGIRFFLTFALLSLFLWRRLAKATRAELKASLILGTALFSCMSLEALSLTMTPSSTVAFLENSSVIWVVLFEAVLLRAWPSKRTLLATGLIVAGITLLTLKGAALSLSLGEMICIGASICYAVWIILLGKFAKNADALIIGVGQMGVLAFWASLTAVLTEPIVVPTDSATWYALAGLILICSVFSFTLQSVAQKYASAEKAGLFTAINPLLAAIFGWLLLGETMGPAQIIGGAFIITSIVLLQVKPKKQEKPIIPHHTPKQHKQAVSYVAGH